MKIASTDPEKKHVETWEQGVWDYMKAGHEKFYVKVHEKPPHTSIAPGYIESVLVTASWAGDKPPYRLLTGVR